MTYPLYRILAECLAMAQAEGSFKANRQAIVEHIVANLLPSGSGFDNGVRLREDSTGEKLIFEVGYHPLNENGYYEAWQTTIVKALPSLISGVRFEATKGCMTRENRDYVLETLSLCLMQKYEYFVKDRNDDGTVNLCIREVKA